MDVLSGQRKGVLSEGTDRHIGAYEHQVDVPSPSADSSYGFPEDGPNIKYMYGPFTVKMFAVKAPIGTMAPKNIVLMCVPPVKIIIDRLEAGPNVK